MLLNRGRLGDVVLLGRKTVELMTLDHLPKAHPNLSIGTQCFRFGLGVSVVTDVAESRCLSSLGDFGWGGMLGTQVWMNPEEEMITMIMIQVRSEIPTGIMDIYKRLVYQALVA
jgi:CubicO group peptidase (beta-lactamase class C family)